MQRSEFIKDVYKKLKDAGYPEPSISLIEDTLHFAEELGMSPPFFTVNGSHHKSMYPEFNYEEFCEVCSGETLNKWEPEE